MLEVRAKGNSGGVLGGNEECAIETGRKDDSCPVSRNLADLALVFCGR
jgi:hypothetical protein